MLAKTLKERFNEKWIFDPVTGCHNWIGSKKQPYGYGQLNVDGVTTYAHRLSLSWKLNKPIQDLDFACHACDNPMCVNPNHLFEGGHRSNGQDMANKQRGGNQQGSQDRTHCKKGHELTSTNIQTKDAKRGCLQCYKDRQKRWAESPKGQASIKKKAQKYYDTHLRKGGPNGISSDID